jgi:hypothetical protein
MKPSELRIGNLIRIKESDTNIQVEQHLLCETELINYEPIALTEERLLNLGFEKQNGQFGSFYIKSPYSALFGFFDNNNNFIVMKREAAKKYLWIKNLSFVHQFQNIFFVLTDEELEMKSINTQK